MAKTETPHNVKTGIFSGIYKLHFWQVSSADLEYSLAPSMRNGWKLHEEIAMIKMTVMIGTDIDIATAVRIAKADNERRAERNKLSLWKKAGILYL